MSQGLVWVSVRSSIHRQSMHVDHWEITSPTSITPLQPIQRKKSINNSNLSLVSSLHLSLTPYSHFSAVTEVKTQCANVCVRCRPIEKVKVLKWNQHREEKNKSPRKARWWFKQGSELSIRHYADGESVSGERGREREWEENSKRMIVEILQDCRRKGKECEEEVSRRVTRCYKEGRTRVSVKLGDDKRVHIKVRQGCWELLRTLIKQIKTE